MATVERSVELAVPIHEAFMQWERVEEFPRFVDAVERVDRLDEDRSHWVARIGGRTREWTAHVTGRATDFRISWESEDGPSHQGSVLLQPIDETHTLMNLTIAYQPEGPIESGGAALGFVRRAVDDSLKQFKQLVETPRTGLEDVPEHLNDSGTRPGAPKVDRELTS